ncbi:hypothetical protein PR202_ga30225 [Eleusine coracana subsp. coracana]|uniref:Late embryogenesis abundant protein LEA-2 subgroup domain-containing protein n=1 Tax=Eleusine coracana subsp. coracana TaxID=191504 RepID=A0AAV5DP58_ELECO|nr:hypothetical protein QOZ80_4AG0327740 [Eleusine coracana subsp. coracana]GJN11985.1 hypothetical protein PR202_ga30225 [Eleusine coracana subsp. coracana]
MTLSYFALVAMVFVVASYGILYPVSVTVEDPSLSRFALNGTSSALAYDLSLTVYVDNPNSAMRAVNTKPLNADLRFAGARLAAKGHAIGKASTDQFYLKAAGEVDDLGSDGVAELVKETVAGTLESLEIKIYGEVMYRPVHLGRYKLSFTCPLKLQIAPPNVVVLGNVINCYCSMIIVSPD